MALEGAQVVELSEFEQLIRIFQPKIDNKIQAIIDNKNNEGLRQIAIKALATLLSQTPIFKTTVKIPEDDRGWFEDLGEMFGSAPKLAIIDLSEMDLTPVDVKTLTSSLGKTKNFEQLELGVNPQLGATGTFWVVNALMGSQIEVLSLSKLGIKLAFFAEALLQLSHLTHLEVNSNPLGDKEFAQLGAKLPETLLYIDARDTGICAAGVIDFLKQSTSHALVEVNFKDNAIKPFTREEATKIAQLLGRFPDLQMRHFDKVVTEGEFFPIVRDAQQNRPQPPVDRAHEPTAVNQALAALHLAPKPITHIRTASQRIAARKQQQEQALALHPRPDDEGKQEGPRAHAS